MQINTQIYHIFDRYMYTNDRILYQIDQIHYLYVINVFSISFLNSMINTDRKTDEHVSKSSKRDSNYVIMWFKK